MNPLPGWHRARRRGRYLWAIGTLLCMALIGFTLTLAVAGTPHPGPGTYVPQPPPVAPGPPVPLNDPRALESPGDRPTDAQERT